MQRQKPELDGDNGKHSQSQRNYKQNLEEMTPELWRVSDCEELVGVTWRVSDCEEIVGVFHRKRCWSWGKIFRQYRAILA